MANLKVMDQNGKDSIKFLVLNLMIMLFLKQSLDKEPASVKVLQRLRIDLLFAAVVRSLGDKRVLVVLVKVLSELHNGVVVVQYLAQLHVHMHTLCQESNVVWLLSQFFPKS